MLTTDQHFVLKRDHPYLQFIGLDLYELLPGKWKVAWRDFTGLKQDAEFDCCEAAQVYRDRIWSKAHLIDRSMLEDACLSFEDAEAFWLAID